MLSSMLRAAARSAGRYARTTTMRSSAAVVTAGKASYGTLSQLLTPHSGSVAFAATAAVIGMSPVVFAAAPKEKSFIMIKPDGVQRGLVSEIIRRFESKGYKLVGLKVLHPTKDLAAQHYEEHDGKPFFPKLVNFLSSGPVVAMVWEGKEVVKYGRTMIGATNPLASAPGTIRGDFGIDVGRNIIHGSDSVESAQREIALWFTPEELVDWEPVTGTWAYE